MLWPRGGWGRAASYVGYRLRRLPDTPEKISRGIFMGVFTSFTPFYGLHFLIAAGLAKMTRGNILAALLGTFFGNPLTYIPIAVVSMKTGHFLLGSTMDEQVKYSLFETFKAAGEGLRNNLLALFTHRPADWSGLTAFYDQVFLPYLVGGIAPGIVSGLICYFLSVSLISAYQKRRRGALAAKLSELRKKTGKRPDDVTESD